MSGTFARTNAAGRDVANTIANGMTGQTTAQAAIDALTGAAAATETHVLTRGADGHAAFAAAGGSSESVGSKLYMYSIMGSL